MAPLVLLRVAFDTRIKKPFVLEACHLQPSFLYCTINSDYVRWHVSYWVYLLAGLLWLKNGSDVIGDLVSASVIPPIVFQDEKNLTSEAARLQWLEARGRNSLSQDAQTSNFLNANQVSVLFLTWA